MFFCHISRISYLIIPFSQLKFRSGPWLCNFAFIILFSINSDVNAFAHFYMCIILVLLFFNLLGLEQLFLFLCWLVCGNVHPGSLWPSQRQYHADEVRPHVSHWLWKNFRSCANIWRDKEVSVQTSFITVIK